MRIYVMLKERERKFESLFWKRFYTHTHTHTHNTAQRSTTQHNAAQRSTTQHNAAQHNDTHTHTHKCIHNIF
jgi:hypothetical protein